MSTIDTLMPCISGPWPDPSGSQLPCMPIPGLSSEAIKTLVLPFAATLSPERRELLGFCSGLQNTVLGSIDFTGCFFPSEPLRVFQPCITLAIDDAGRRWIAEVSADDDGITGRVWCVLPEPKVALYVADDLGQFLTILREHTGGNSALAWLQSLDTEARNIWANRHSLAVRPYQAPEIDTAIRAWIARLPSDAFIYDLRGGATRGWPYGLLGSSARLYRCGPLPVFAVAGWFVDSPHCPHPAEHLPRSTARELPARSVTLLPARGKSPRRLTIPAV